LLTASARLVRIDSADRNQYYTDDQWRTWSYSSCSGMAMAMVMNSYGRHLIAAEVLQQEAQQGVWNVSLGLLRDDGIGMAAAYYGFDNDTSHSRTLQDVIAIANQGKPVIVSVRDSYYFPGGHISSCAAVMASMSTSPTLRPETSNVCHMPCFRVCGKVLVSC